MGPEPRDGVHALASFTRRLSAAELCAVQQWPGAAAHCGWRESQLLAHWRLVAPGWCFLHPAQLWLRSHLQRRVSRLRRQPDRARLLHQLLSGGWSQSDRAFADPQDRHAGHGGGQRAAPVLAQGGAGADLCELRQGLGTGKLLQGVARWRQEEGVGCITDQGRQAAGQVLWQGAHQFWRALALAGICRQAPAHVARRIARLTRQGAKRV